MSRIIDLDAARAQRAAARAEAGEESPVVRLEGRTFELPVELPADAIERLGPFLEQGPEALRVGLEVFLGEHYEPIMALGLSMDDAKELLEGVADAYGFDMGESPASSDS